MVAVRVCRTDALTRGVVRSVPLGTDESGLPIVALLLRDEDGHIRAYRNLCRHLPVPLDGGTGAFLTSDGTHLLCGTHGATYRLRDGLCIDGPCEGLGLLRLPCEERHGVVYVSC